MRKIVGFSPLFFMLLSCGEEAFAPNQTLNEVTTDVRGNYESASCSQGFTVVRPKVDFLFLNDNSGSAGFITEDTKAALNGLIDSISNRFDYHILIAPLVASGNEGAELLSRSSDGLSGSARRIDRGSVKNVKAFDLLETVARYGSSGTGEAGVQRAIDLLNGNRGNGIFRKNAYTIVVVISTEDDDSWFPASDRYSDPRKRDKYVRDQLARLRDIERSLDSQMMRFFTISPHSLCEGAGRVGHVYRRVSEGFSPGDAYDFCGRNFTAIFDGINQSISDVIQDHRYRYWPVAESGRNIDLDSIVVTKDGRVLGTHEYTYAGDRRVDLREWPDRGDSYKGHVIRLKEYVQRPQCLTVSFQRQSRYYGFAWIERKPREESIKITINGRVIPQGSTNGWQLIRDNNGEPQHISNQNIQIRAPGDYSPGSPGKTYSGYFLKLYGDAVYSDGDSVKVKFLAAPR